MNAVNAADGISIKVITLLSWFSSRTRDMGIKLETVGVAEARQQQPKD
jgi:hypothetical protein